MKKKKDIVGRIKEVIADLDKVQAEGREMTETEKAEIEKVLLSIAEQRLEELGWDK
jgi:hypothetical protein